MNTSLNAARRARELAEATDGRVVDLLVVGLGVTGAGVALDAAARGLSVVAVDAHDLAFGTSRWSSKLVHGGLRYLANGQVGVAYESAVERHVLMTRTAPHLVHPLASVIPLGAGVSRGQAGLTRVGYALGDALRAAARTPRGVLPRPRRLDAAQTRLLAPAVRAAGLRGGLLGWDGQLEDDARLVVAIARTAAGRGARLLTRCRALALAGDGARLRDELTGTEHEVRARAVINATGVWAGSLVPGVALRPSRGSHAVLPSRLLGDPSVALTVPVPGSRNRFVFALPQPDGLSYLGLTDEPVEEIPDEPAAPESDLAFLLDVLNAALEVPVRRADLLGSYAGLRPLLDGTASTADISRRHAVLSAPNGVVTVVGGKLTTYRRMAQDAVDAAVAARPGLAAGPCVTRDLPLVGAGAAPDGAPARYGRRYGAEAGLLADLVRDDPALGEPVGPGLPVTGAEFAFAVRHEGALDVDDLLDRRTRLGLVPAERALAVPAAERALSAG